MGYSFTIQNGFRPKTYGYYPWPYEGDKHRLIELFTDDVLTKSEDGTWMKHTGLGCFRIQLTDDQVEPIEKPVHLRIG